MSLRNSRSFFQVFWMIVTAILLSACGRKGDLEPSIKTGYPRQYPAQQPDCDVE